MPRVHPNTMTDFATDIFTTIGIPDDVARQVSVSLVLGNLSGHDSHGVIRIIEYVGWTLRGWINPHAELIVEREQPCMLILNGNFGFGQVIGRQAMELGIKKAKTEGVCVVSLRQSAHLGRVGEFMEQAADAGIIAFGFTNTHGGGVLVAPHGGCERRLSANPLVAGAPIPGGPHMVMDMSTSTIAEGKIKVARSKGESLPSGLFVNGEGDPSTSPEEYYAAPPGALLPLAGHKGFALSLCCEVLAGAMTGAGCSKRGVDRIANGFLAFLLDPCAFAGQAEVEKELSGLRQWVKSSRLQKGFDSIQFPGEPEAHAREDRSAAIEIDETTWNKICAIATERNVRLPEVT